VLSGPLYLRTAVPADLDRLIRWRAQVAEWVARKNGSTQWSTPLDTELALARIEQGATVMAMLEPDGEPVATRSVLPTGDPALWTAEELAVPARYLAKFTVDRRYAGRGIGTLLTDWARRRAHRAGAEVVRLDAWTDNPGLHAYHRGYGWRQVRTVPGPVSGVLFEMPVLTDPFDPAVREVGDIVLPGD
jgi:GNAT superfamily N-acetyltransferase